MSLTIGQAAAATGISAKMIRHYEAQGLLPAPARSDGGYRLFSDADLHALRFIRHARDLGFPIATIGELLGLWHDRDRPSRDVKTLALAHIEALDRKAHELLRMKATLQRLVGHCHGDDRPDCPILESLAAPELDAASAGAAPACAAHSTPGATAGRAKPI